MIAFCVAVFVVVSDQAVKLLLRRVTRSYAFPPRASAAPPNRISTLDRSALRNGRGE